MSGARFEAGISVEGCATCPLAAAHGAYGAYCRHPANGAPLLGVGPLPERAPDTCPLRRAGKFARGFEILLVEPAE